MGLFGFLFGKGEDRSAKPPSGGAQKDGEARRDASAPDYEAEKQAPQEELSPLMDAVLSRLSAGRDRIIRFSPAASESPAAFLRALSPGDVMLGNRCQRLVLENELADGASRLKLLESNLGHDLRIVELPGRKLDLSKIEEVIGQRRQSFQLDTRDVNPDVLQAASVLLGRGKLGSDFRQMHVTGQRLICAEVNGENGRIVGIRNTNEEELRAVLMGIEQEEGPIAVVMQTSSLFETEADFIYIAQPLGELSARADKNFMNAVAIVNCFENAEKLTAMEGLTGPS